MVKIYALCVLHKGANEGKLFKSVYDLQRFGFFERGSVQEFMGFVAKTIVERTQLSCRQSVKEGGKKLTGFDLSKACESGNPFADYFCHVYVRGDSLAGVVICDHEYPQRVAHTLITKFLDEFSHAYPPSRWQVLSEREVDFNQLNVYITKYQNPAAADAMTKIQEDLNETTIILQSTIEDVLKRGEKLDDLITKSEGLSIQSKAFYKTAKKTNSCCSFG